MSGLLGPKKPKKVNQAKEKATLERQRLALLKRSAFNRNTRTSGGSGVEGPANTFRSTLGG